MKKAFLMATAVLMAAPVVAEAKDGWYGSIDTNTSIGGGVDMDPEMTANASNSLFTGGLTDFDGDFGYGLGLGYGFDNGFRIEGNVTSRLDQLEQETAQPLNFGGKAKSLALMLNVLKDFNTEGNVNPYIGVGAGLLSADVFAAGLVTKPGAAAPAGTVTGIDDQDSALAGQFLAGVGVKITPRLVLDMGYRYLASKDLELAPTFGASSGAPAGVYKTTYSHQALNVGLRYLFGAPAAAPVAEEVPLPPPPPPLPPAPPPPPPPSVCATSSFVVYFEFDRANLTPEAQSVLDRAIAEAASCNYNQVVVSGHTDKSGSDKYNAALSARRAAVVRDGLVSRGVAASLIAEEALGEAKPAVATRDGVKEPLNRRTEVVITFR